jgi:hypothetical protein
VLRFNHPQVGELLLNRERLSIGGADGSHARRVPRGCRFPRTRTSCPCSLPRAYRSPPGWSLHERVEGAGPSSTMSLRPTGICVSVPAPVSGRTPHGPSRSVWSTTPWSTGRCRCASSDQCTTSCVR